VVLQNPHKLDVSFAELKYAFKVLTRIITKEKGFVCSSMAWTNMKKIILKYPN